MAATVPVEPASPASCYRPLRFEVQRTDPAGTLIVEVFIADSSDVSSLGNGLEVGDVVVYFTGSVFGAVSVQAGQTIIMDADCGPYAGVQMITNYFVDGSDKYMVIDAVDSGDFTPDSMTGSFKVWLNNYTIHCRILIYTNPTGSPQVVDLAKLPNASGRTTFDVDLRIRDYFSHRIDTLMADGTLFDAHGITALFYRVHIAEVYDVPGETEPVDPYDGDHTLLEDDTEDIATMRVAVNARHPYAGSLLSWSDEDMSDFVVGSTSSKFLTNMPRRIKLGRGDKLRLFMLTDFENGYEFSMRRRISVTGVGAEETDIENTDPSAAFGIACGPADIAGLFGTEPTSYSVSIRTTGGTTISEVITIDVDDTCREGNRMFGWLGGLGGVDMYAFHGREISRSKVKRATLRKGYTSGTGFDYTERSYRTEAERSAVVSTLPVPIEVTEWLGADLFESPNVNAVVSGKACTCVILTDSVDTYNTGPHYKPFTMEYRLGVNSVTQQA